MLWGKIQLSGQSSRFLSNFYVEVKRFLLFTSDVCYVYILLTDPGLHVRGTAYRTLNYTSFTTKSRFRRKSASGQLLQDGVKWSQRTLCLPCSSARCCCITPCPQACSCGCTVERCTRYADTRCGLSSWHLCVFVRGRP